MAKKVIPSIHIPIQDKDGSMSLPWYLFLKWIVDNSGDIDEIQEEIDDLQDTKVDKTSDAEKLYGTDENGDQTTYDIDSLIPDVNLDNVTIDKNSSDQLQAIGVKNKNSASGATSTIYDWVGTLAEYNAQNIATEHPDWVCYITDDTNPDTTYTKAEADALFVRKTGNYNEEANGTKNWTGIVQIRYGKTAPSTNTTKSASVDDNYISANSNTSGKVDGMYILRRQGTNGDRFIIYGAGFRDGADANNIWTELQIGIAQNDSRFARVSTTDMAVGTSSYDIVTTRHLIRVLAAIYPVGSIFITEANSCPMAQFFGTWTLQSNATNRALWGGNGSNGGGTIAAGIPNLYGWWRGGNAANPGADGTLIKVDSTASGHGWDGASNMMTTWSFSASRYNSIYGSSTTVQPPAYRVNVWKRTA